MEPLLLLFWVGAAVGCGLIASQRGRSGVGWAFTALLISPLLAYMGLVAIPMLSNGLERDADVPREPESPVAKWLKEGDDTPVFRGPR